VEYVTQKKVTIKDVLYIPELGVNLLSLSLITSKNFSLSFNRQNCFIYTPSNSLLTKGSYKEGVSVFSAISSKSSNLSISNKPLAILNTINTNVLHHRAGQPTEPATFPWHGQLILRIFNFIAIKQGIYVCRARI
jgi:hypothetical protein